jgi:hypothetical protein
VRVVYWLKVLGIGCAIAPALFKDARASLLPAEVPLPLPIQVLTTLRWEPSAGSSVAGYAVYYRSGTLPFTNRVDMGNALALTLPLLVGTHYSFYVVAYTASGAESVPSNVVAYSPVAVSRLRLSRQANGAMRIQFHTVALAACQVECSQQLNPPQWQTLATVVANVNGDVVLDDPTVRRPSVRYYRAVLP